MKEPKPMREIHQIQEKIYREDKHLSRKAQMAKRHREAGELIEKYGLKLKKSFRKAA